MVEQLFSKRNVILVHLFIFNFLLKIFYVMTLPALQCDIHFHKKIVYVITLLAL